MVRMARTLCRHLESLVGDGDSVRLDGPREGGLAPVLDYRSLSVKVQKRLLFPLRMRLRRADVLHIVNADYLPGLIRSRLASTVATCHDMMPFLAFDSLEEAFPKRLGLAFYRESLRCMVRCGLVVTDSEFSRRCILEYSQCAADRVRVIPLGIDTCFRPLEAGSQELENFGRRHGLEGKRVVLHVGTTEGYKNIETVLEVVANLRRRMGDRLVLLKVGGAFSPKQRDLIESLGLVETVLHRTGLSEEELVAAYNAAEVLLWPSRFEGFGLPVLEAMACGTPVVCSNGGSLPELAEGAAAMHDPLDVEGLTASCQTTMEDAVMRERLKAAGLSRAAQYTWDRTAHEYYAAYRAVNQGTV